MKEEQYKLNSDVGASVEPDWKLTYNALKAEWAICAERMERRDQVSNSVASLTALTVLGW